MMVPVMLSVPSELCFRATGSTTPHSRASTSAHPQLRFQQEDAADGYCLAERRLRVDKRTVERAWVQVSKRFWDEKKFSDTPLAQEQAEVERVSINRVVDEPARASAKVILSLYEEVLVTKQLEAAHENAPQSHKTRHGRFTTIKHP